MNEITVSLSETSKKRFDRLVTMTKNADTSLSYYQAKNNTINSAIYYMYKLMVHDNMIPVIPEDYKDEFIHEVCPYA